MDVKTLFGLTVVPGAIFGATVVACLSKRIRDLFFVLLIFLAPMVENLDVNFVSREWYRGTSRGFEVSVLDVLMLALLFSSVLVPRRGEARAYWPPAFGLMLVLFLYAAGNAAFADPQLFALFELWKWFRGLVLALAVAFYLRNERELRLLIFSFAILIWYQALICIKERYVDGINRVPGTFVASNSVSVLLALVTPPMVAAINSDIPKWLKLLCVGAIPLACVAEVLTISRMGSVILPMALLGAVMATVSYRITARKLAITALVVLVGAGIAAKSWHTLTSRFKEVSLKDEYGKKNLGRGYYLRVAKAIASEELFGVGLNNWSYWVSGKWGHKLGYGFVPYRGTDREPSHVVPAGALVDDEAQAAPAHNLGALTVGELGIPGLLLFSLLWMRWFQMGASFLWPRSSDPMRRMGVGILFGFLGIAAHSWTEWAFRQYTMYYLAHILAGALASLYFLKRKADKLQALEHEESLQPIGIAAGTTASGGVGGTEPS